MQKPVKIEPEWKEALAEYFTRPEFSALADFVRQEYQTKKIFPPPADVFRAFYVTPFSKVKVVILGQDPYHNDRQAHGLCFSVPQGESLPPSLLNIYREIESDLGIKKNPADGNLEDWAKQGVFLLNAILTVVAHQPASHRGRGWEEFTDIVIKTLSDSRENLVFLLWGNYARGKIALIDQQKHLILEAPHPSPLSAYAGFFGCKHFSKCNDYLKSHGLEPIIW